MICYVDLICLIAVVRLLIVDLLRWLLLGCLVGCWLFVGLLFVVVGDLLIR